MLPSDKIAQAMDQIATWEFEDAPRIPEQIFIARYLPLFASKAETPVDITPWLDVCRHGMLWVNVVDQAGQVIFRVPPLYRGIDVTAGLGQVGKMPMSEIMSNAELKDSVYPSSGAHYMAAHFENRFKATSQAVEMAQIWNDIFTRYGYEMPYPEAGLSGKAGGQTTDKATVGEAGPAPLTDMGFSDI